MKAKLIVITPCSRLQNLALVCDSLRFDYILKWIVVHDTTRAFVRPAIELLSNPKIVQISQSGGISGNPQRNRALDEISHSFVEPGTFVYFLDDDNVIHPQLWNILDHAQPGRIYSFDALSGEGMVPEEEFLKFWRQIPCTCPSTDQTVRLRGSSLTINSIDTAQVLIDFDLIGNIRWQVDRYDADGVFIEEVQRNHPYKHQYISEVACYYNFLRPPSVETEREVLTKLRNIHNAMIKGT